MTLAELSRLAHDAERMYGSSELTRAVIAFVAADRDSRLAGQVAARERAEKAIARITAEGAS